MTQQHPCRAVQQTYLQRVLLLLLAALHGCHFFKHLQLLGLHHHVFILIIGCCRRGGVRGTSNRATFGGCIPAEAAAPGHWNAGVGRLGRHHACATGQLDLSQRWKCHTDRVLISFSSDMSMLGHLAVLVHSPNIGIQGGIIIGNQGGNIIGGWRGASVTSPPLCTLWGCVVLLAGGGANDGAAAAIPAKKLGRRREISPSPNTQYGNQGLRIY